MLLSLKDGPNRTLAHLSRMRHPVLSEMLLQNIEPSTGRKRQDSQERLTALSVSLTMVDGANTVRTGEFTAIQNAVNSVVQADRKRGEPPAWVP
jgi:hypothetical protein